MRYTRAKFREWLESLPPNEPFCKLGKCPISQFLGLDGADGLRADETLAWAIDDLAHGERGLPWETLSPSDVLDVLNTVDRARDQER